MIKKNHWNVKCCIYKQLLHLQYSISVDNVESLITILFLATQLNKYLGNTAMGSFHPLVFFILLSFSRCFSHLPLSGKFLGFSSLFLDIKSPHHEKSSPLLLGHHHLPMGTPEFTNLQLN